MSNHRFAMGNPSLRDISMKNKRRQGEHMLKKKGMKKILKKEMVLQIKSLKQGPSIRVGSCMH